MQKYWNFAEQIIIKCNKSSFKTLQNLHIKLTYLQNPNPRAFFVLRSAFVWLLSSRPTLVPSALAQINSAWHSLYSSINRLLVDCLWNFAPCSMVWVNSLSRWVLGLIPRMWKPNRRKFWLQNIHEFNKCRWMCLATNPSARVQLDRTRFRGKAWCGPRARPWIPHGAAGNFLAGKMTSPDRGLDLSVCLTVCLFVSLLICLSFLFASFFFSSFFSVCLMHLICELYRDMKTYEIYCFGT